MELDGVLLEVELCAGALDEALSGALVLVAVDSVLLCVNSVVIEVPQGFLAPFVASRPFR